MPAPNPRFIDLGGNKYKLREDLGQPPLRLFNASVHKARDDVGGDPSAINLSRHVWPWTMTDFSGGEGLRVLTRDTPDQNRYWKTDGGIDVSIPGQFSMQPLMNLVIAADGTATTRTEGNAQTNAVGTETNSGSNKLLNAVNEGGYVTDTPGAVSVTIAARFIDDSSGGEGNYTLRLRIYNQTGAADVQSVTQVVTNKSPSPVTLTTTFTALAATVYRYYGELSAYTDGQASLDYTDVTANAASTTDSRAILHGLDDEVWMCHWDGTNIDLFKWDFTNDEWDLVHGNMLNSQIVAMASSDRYLYTLHADKTVNFTDGTTEGNYLAASPAGTAAGIAVAGDRLYYLTFGATRYLYEGTLDGAGSFVENTSDYKRVMTNADFPSEESHDTLIRQAITSIGNGVRFFVNLRGGQTQMYEFSEGAGRPMFPLPQGVEATAIHHYGGVTFVGVQFASRASAPAVTRAGVFFYDASGVPQLLGKFRPDDPDDEPISYITAWEDSVYFLQGLNIWRYNASTGGITLDRTTGASDETAARGLVVMDKKMWAAYASQGVFVSRDEYPKDNTMRLYSPRYFFDSPDINKVIISFKVRTAPLPANTTVSVDYDTDESGTWTSAGTAMSTLNDTTETWAISTGSSTKKGETIQWRCNLASSDGVDTPEVRSVHTRVHALEYERVFECYVDARDSGSGDHPPGDQPGGSAIVDRLDTLRSNGNVVTLKDYYHDKNPADFDTYNVILTEIEPVYEDQGEGYVRVQGVII